MKKIFLGGPGSCDVHFEKDMLKMFMDTYYTNYETINDYKNADIIVIMDTCIGTYKNLETSINYIEKVILNKKKDAKVIVSGCLIKGVNFELNNQQKNILKQVVCIKPDKLTKYICRILRPNFDLEFEETDWLEDFDFPYEWARNSISFSIVEGCSNRCSFCKSNYMNFPIKSIPYEKLVSMTNGLRDFDYPFNHMQIHSSNLSLYGIDLYGNQQAHKAIKLLTSPECIKFVNLSCLINFYPELIKEIIENPKIKMIFVSMESGSEKIYNLMNRPISLSKLTEIIRIIKRNRPDIIINTELVCGFPTETIDDLKRSIELIEELDINPLHAHPYTDSKQIPSSKLKQHSFTYNQECSRYVKEKLKHLNEKYQNIIANGEMIVVEKNQEEKIYLVQLIDGNIIKINFNQFDKNYNINDFIPANTIISKQVTKKRVLKNKEQKRIIK